MNRKVAFGLMMVTCLLVALFFATFRSDPVRTTKAIDNPCTVSPQGEQFRNLVKAGEQFTLIRVQREFVANADKSFEVCARYQLRARDGSDLFLPDGLAEFYSYCAFLAKAPNGCAKFNPYLFKPDDENYEGMKFFVRYRGEGGLVPYRVTFVQWEVAPPVQVKNWERISSELKNKRLVMISGTVQGPIVPKGSYEIRLVLADGTILEGINRDALPEGAHVEVFFRSSSSVVRGEVMAVIEVDNPEYPEGRLWMYLFDDAPNAPPRPE